MDTRARIRAATADLAKSILNCNTIESHTIDRALRLLRPASGSLHVAPIKSRIVRKLDTLNSSIEQSNAFEKEYKALLTYYPSGAILLPSFLQLIEPL